MNFILAEILQRGFTEEEAFWFFVYLLESLLSIDYYTSMVGIMVTQRIFFEIICEKEPEILNKFSRITIFHLFACFFNLDEFKVDASFFSLHWFICLFVGTVNRNILNVIWDNLFAFGEKILFKAGVLLIKHIKDAILDAEDFGFLQY